MKRISKMYLINLTKVFSKILIPATLFIFGFGILLLSAEKITMLFLFVLSVFIFLSIVFFIIYKWIIVKYINQSFLTLIKESKEFE